MRHTEGEVDRVGGWTEKGVDREGDGQRGKVG